MTILSVVILEADDLPSPCRLVLGKVESFGSRFDQQDLFDSLIDDELIANEIIFNLHQAVSELLLRSQLLRLTVNARDTVLRPRSASCAEVSMCAPLPIMTEQMLEQSVLPRVVHG